MASHDDHYRTVARVYSFALFYDAQGPFVQWLKAELESVINLKVTDTLADVGGGDGEFALALAASAGLPRDRVAVVEPSAAMLHSAAVSPVSSVDSGIDAADEGATASGPHRINLGALEWCDLKRGNVLAGPIVDFSCVLIKEVVHHFVAPRTILFRDLRERRMQAGGKLVIVTRPQQEYDYPFFDAARNIWIENQPSTQELKTELTAAGYKEVEHTMLRYPLSLATEEWCKMIRNRFWSTFSHFNDEELLAGTEEIQQTTKGSDTLQFEERIVVITAKA